MMRVHSLAALLVCCAGCAEHPPSSTSPRPTVVLAPPAATSTALAAPLVPDREPVLEPSAVFVSDAEGLFRRRAALSHSGPIRFNHAGPALGPTEREPLDDRHELIVLENGPDRVRVLAKSDKVELAMYVPVEDFALTTTAVTELELNVDHPADARVELFPGAPFEIDATPGLTRKASLRNERITITGGLPVRGVGRVFVPVARQVPAATHQIETAVSVLAKPRGAPIASLTPSDYEAVLVRLLGGPVDGHQKIAVDGPRFLIEGWVPETAVTSGTDTGTGSFHTFGWGSGSQFELPRGTTLYGGPNQPQVGRLLADETVSGAFGPRDERTPIGLHLKPWGFIQVWIDNGVAEAAWERQRVKKRDTRHVVVDKVVMQGFADAKAKLEAQAEDVAACARGELEASEPLPTGSFEVLVRLGPTGAPEQATVSRVAGALVEVKGFRSCAEQALLVRAKPLDAKKGKTGSIRATLRLAKPP